MKVLKLEFTDIELLEELKWMLDNGYINIKELEASMRQIYNFKENTNGSRDRKR